MVSMVREDNSAPEWLQILLRERFFTPCSLHQSSKKNEKTFFCVCCRLGICFSCLSSHRTHCFLQIRRYVYHEVIRLGDAEKLLNCSLVQPYTTNSAKVVFLKDRPNTRPFRGSGNLCITCFRTLQDPYLFCSLSCKMNQQVSDKIEINKQNENYDQLIPPPSRSETQSLSEQKTPNSVFDLDFPCAPKTGGGVPVPISPTTSVVSATSKLVKKKRSCVKSLAAVLCRRPRCFPVPDIATAVNRRKGVPQRSPLS